MTHWSARGCSRRFGTRGCRPTIVAVFDEAHKLSATVRKRPHPQDAPVRACGSPRRLRRPRASRFDGLGWEAASRAPAHGDAPHGSGRSLPLSLAIARPAGVRDRRGVPPFPSAGPRTLLHPSDQGGDGWPRWPTALSASRVQHVQLRPFPRPRWRTGAVRGHHRLPPSRLRPRARQPPRRAARDERLSAPACKLELTRFCVPSSDESGRSSRASTICDPAARAPRS